SPRLNLWKTKNLPAKKSQASETSPRARGAGGDVACARALEDKKSSCKEVPSLGDIAAGAPGARARRMRSSTGRQKIFLQRSPKPRRHRRGRAGRAATSPALELWKTKNLPAKKSQASETSPRARGAGGDVACARALEDKILPA